MACMVGRRHARIYERMSGSNHLPNITPYSQILVLRSYSRSHSRNEIFFSTQFFIALVLPFVAPIHCGYHTHYHCTGKRALATRTNFLRAIYAKIWAKNPYKLYSNVINELFTLLDRFPACISIYVWSCRSKFRYCFNFVSISTNEIRLRLTLMASPAHRPTLWLREQTARGFSISQMKRHSSSMLFMNRSIQGSSEII